MASPAFAQVSGSASVESDYRFRGHSLSAGHPVTTLDLGYDHGSGIYVNGSAIVVIDDDDGPALLGVVASAGYATHVSPTLSLDAGVLHTEYTHYFSAGRSTDYTEVYLGMTARRFSARAYYSPDYFNTGSATLYGELEGALQPAPGWRLSGHVGALAYLDWTPSYVADTQYDWRVGVARQIDSLDLHVALSGGGPGPDRYTGTPRDRTAVVFGATWLF